MSRALKAKGKPIPKHYYPPELMPGADEWLRDFYELSTDRQITGYGSGPIPAASIARHTAGWDDAERQTFTACIRAMDTAFLDATAPAKEGEEKGGLPQPPGVVIDKKRRRQNHVKNEG